MVSVSSRINSNYKSEYEFAEAAVQRERVGGKFVANRESISRFSSFEVGTLPTRLLLNFNLRTLDRMFSYFSYGRSHWMFEEKILLFTEVHIIFQKNFYIFVTKFAKNIIIILNEMYNWLQCLKKDFSQTVCLQ